MRLFEAILDSNDRWVRGDEIAVLARAEHADFLPVVALTCVDPRLDAFLPQALGIDKTDFVAFRSLGNTLDSPLGSIARFLALACAVKGGRELAVIGHTDCSIAKTTVLTLTDAFASMGVGRDELPQDLTEFFGLFASERQNVIKAVELLRQSPLIGTKLPVHGLLMDTQTGRLEWIVNGYTAPAPATVHPRSELKIQASVGGKEIAEARVPLPSLALGEMKFPDLKIGEVNVSAAMQQSAVPTPEQSVSAAARPAEQHAPEEQSDWLALLRELATRAIQVHVIGNDMRPYGPVPMAKLLEWVVEKRVGPNTPAQVEGTNAWQPLSILVKALKHGELRRIPETAPAKTRFRLFGPGRKS